MALPTQANDSTGLVANAVKACVPPGATGLVPGQMIIDGDILVPLGFFEAETAYRTNLWPAGVVPYVFDANVDSTNRARMLAGMSDWEGVASIDFVPRNGEANYVLIVAANQNLSSIGMAEGEQSLLISFYILTMQFLYPETDWIFVDQSNTGVENGTFFNPFNTFAEGLQATPTGGTLWIQPGTYSSAGNLSRAMTIRAPIGGVTVNN